jgi:hypothetical protein
LSEADAFATPPFGANHRRLHYERGGRQLAKVDAIINEASPFCRPVRTDLIIWSSGSPIRRKSRVFRKLHAGPFDGDANRDRRPCLAGATGLKSSR